jgi:ketosteroid isomerase-like protein
MNFESTNLEEVFMKRTIVAWVVVLLVATLYPLSILAQTEPDKKAEAEVREVINRWGKLWNENNQSALLEMYHPDAKIMYGWGNQKSTASKKEYEGILPQRITANPSLGLSITKVDVQGEKATVVADSKTKGGVTRTTFEMIKADEKWLITAFRY